MSRPKDKRQKHNKEHKRILSERADLLERLAGYEEQRERDIQAAVEKAISPLQAQLEDATKDAVSAREDAAAANDDAGLLRKQVVRLRDMLEHERQENAFAISAATAREAELKKNLDRIQMLRQEELHEAASTLAEMRSLVDRWKSRARRKEIAEANALLNRMALVGAHPDTL